MIKETLFGKTTDGRDVLAFALQDGNAQITVLNLGGTLQSIVVPDKDGNLVDVLLGYSDVKSYEENGGYLGALIGRFGNRIGEGKFTLEGKEYKLYCNDRGNHLHGGKIGFDKKIWNHEIDGDRLILTLFSPDGDEGYPGNLNVKVVYTFKNGELSIEYEAVSDKTTVVNLTNHAYFNLNGEGKGTILNHVLYLNSAYMVPTNDTMIPVGGLREVKGTAFDFNIPKTIGKDAGADDKELKQGNGYDHCYLLKNGEGNFAHYATAIGDKSGIVMSCYTDMPAVQFYAGNGLHQQGKTGLYENRDGFCLETEAIPNNVNVEEYAAYGSSFLKAGETYSFKAVYKFTTV